MHEMPCSGVGALALPALEQGEEALHHLDVLLAGHGGGEVFVHLVQELGAVLDHLVHGAVIGRGSSLIIV